MSTLPTLCITGKLGLAPILCTEAIYYAISLMDITTKPETKALIIILFEMKRNIPKLSVILSPFLRI